MTSRVWRTRVSVWPLALVACDGRFDLPGRAADEWTRSYPLAEGGQLQIRNTNGSVEIEGVTGSVSLTLPPNAKANLNASVTSGEISVTGLRFEASEQSRRHLSARINGGGTPVTLSTTNGGIRIGAT